MKIAYICHDVSDKSTSVATQVGWIRALASHEGVEEVFVLTPNKGPSELPGNVTVTEFGRGRLGLARLLILAMKVAANVDFFFIAQGGPYPAILLPVKIVWGRPIYHWKAHPHVSIRMRFYVRWCDDLVFTATESSLPINSPKLRIVGHGVDTDVFQPPDVQVDRQGLVYVGRIAPIKRLEDVVHALATCRDRYGITYSLDIIGPGRPSAIDDLLMLADSLLLGGAVQYLGTRTHADLSAIMGQYRAMVNFSQTALDKSALEAMASGLPLVTTNASTLETLPSDMREFLGAQEGDKDSESQAIHRVMTLKAEEFVDVGIVLRQVVVDRHSLDSFFLKILDFIEQDRMVRSQSRS